MLVPWKRWLIFELEEDTTCLKNVGKSVLRPWLELKHHDEGHEAEKWKKQQNLRTQLGPCRGWEGRAQLMFRFLCVTMDDNPDMWAQEERAWKTRFYNQVGHLQVCSTSPCVAALQILFRRIGIYLSFLNEEIERSESVRNLPELWVRPGVCYHTFLTFLSVSNGENSFTGKSMIQFHDLKFPWKG